MRYLLTYWLKPFDAVNDAANATALLEFSWEGPVLEIGGGDGVFSFIMHGGRFAALDDRYDQVNLEQQGDMFNAHRSDRALRVTRAASLRYDIGIDLKWSHLLKSRALGSYKHVVQAAPSPLPFREGTFRTVFLYFPHGLIERGAAIDYAATLAEIRRVLRPDGTLLMTAMNDAVNAHFVCNALAERCEWAGFSRLARYFRRLDGGRRHEIGTFARSLPEWNRLLHAAGFTVTDVRTQLLPIGWRVYDVQTRPVLRPLIRAAQWFGDWGLKPLVKTIWVALWLPVITLFYTLVGRPSRLGDGAAARGVVFVFRAGCDPARIS